MKELLERIARGLVDRPDEVVVEETAGDGGTALALRVAPGDLGKVIGKQGRTVKAIRTLIAAAAARRQKRVVFEILE